MVGSRAAGDDVVARAAVDPIVAGTAEQRVVPAHSKDHVVVTASGEVLALARPDYQATTNVRG